MAMGISNITVHVTMGLFLTQHSSRDYGPLSNHTVYVFIGCFLTHHLCGFEPLTTLCVFLCVRVFIV